MIVAQITPLAYPVDKAHEPFNGACTPKQIRTALNRGELVSRRLGLRTFILHEDLLRWAQSKPIAYRTHPTKETDDNV
jgi:hypothetical protein